VGNGIWEVIQDPVRPTGAAGVAALRNLALPARIGEKAALTVFGL